MPNNKSVFGNFSFDGLCSEGGVEIRNGTICAQNLEVLNITSLNITKQDLTIIDILRVFGNVIFNKNFTVDTNTFFVDSNINRDGIGTTSPLLPFHVFDTLNLGPLARFSRGVNEMDLVIGGTPYVSRIDSDLGFSFRLGGASRMLIQTDGKVGIGTTTPQTLLNVLGLVNFTSNFSVDNNVLFVDSNSNRVGIGTITPVAPLEIQSLAASMRQTRYATVASQSAGLTVQRSGGTTVGTDVIVQDDWRIANFNLRGYDGATYRTAASIQAFIDGTPGGGDMPGRLTFLTTADGSSSATERMRIDSSGNIGIGTTTPQNTLNVLGQLNISGNSTLDGVINLFPSQDASLGNHNPASPSDTSGFVGIIDYSPTFSPINENNAADIIFNVNPTITNNGSDTTGYQFIVLSFSGELKSGTGRFTQTALFDNNAIFSVSEGLATPILPFTFIDRSTLTTDVTSLTSNVADFGSFYDLKTFTTCCTSLGDFDLSVGPDTIHNSFNSQITLGSGLSGIGRINLPVHNSFRVGNPIYAGNQNKIIVEMSGLYIDDLTSPLNAYGIRSILSSGVNRSFINHTGTARSYFGGVVEIVDDLKLSTDTAKLFFGASQDVSQLMDGLSFNITDEVGSIDFFINGFKNLTVENDVTIGGTLFGGSPVKIAGVNISNNLFSLTDNLNSSLRFKLKNENSSTNATSVISTINDVGGMMSIGIGSSNFMIGETNYNNVSAISSRAKGDMVFVNFFNQLFIWLTNPSDDNDPNNLKEVMRLDENTLNVSVNILARDNFTVEDYFFLSNDYSLPPGQNKILKRNSVTKAVFGVSNSVGSASIDSGAGYVLNNTHGQYNLDLHSALDLRNPNDTVHHLLGSNNREIWRLNSALDSEFRFEKGLDNLIVQINRTGLIINGSLIVEEKLGITANYSVGNCWIAYSGGIAYSSNCTAF